MASSNYADYPQLIEHYRDQGKRLLLMDRLHVRMAPSGNLKNCQKEILEAIMKYYQVNYEFHHLIQSYQKQAKYQWLKHVPLDYSLYQPVNQPTTSLNEFTKRLQYDLHFDMPMHGYICLTNQKTGLLFAKPLKPEPYRQFYLVNGRPTKFYQNLKKLQREFRLQILIDWQFQN